MTAWKKLPPASPPSRRLCGLPRRTMPTFRYSAYKAGGSPITGTIEADNAKEARARLKNEGLYPRELTGLADSATKGAWQLFRHRIGLAEISLMTRKRSGAG